MSFSGRPTTLIDHPVPNDGFWPDLDMAEFQKAYRMPAEYLVELLVDGLITAMHEVDRDLAKRKAEWLCAGTLFFCDPPYWQTEGYGVQFEFDQYELLAQLLGEIKGKAIISLKEHPDIRRVFAGFPMEAVDIKYTVDGGKESEAREVLIFSWDVPQRHIQGHRLPDPVGHSIHQYQRSEPGEAHEPP